MLQHRLQEAIETREAILKSPKTTTGVFNRYDAKIRESRTLSTSFNLIFSGSVTQDEYFNSKGYKFLGALYDQQGSEQHVFEITPVPR